jgi:hypothetical protein
MTQTLNAHMNKIKIKKREVEYDLAILSQCIGSEDIFSKKDLWGWFLCNGVNPYERQETHKLLEIIV